MFDEEEWYLKNQWFADTEGLELATMDITVNGSASEPEHRYGGRKREREGHHDDTHLQERIITEPPVARRKPHAGKLTCSDESLT